jgi:hypothetical protein
MGCNNKADKRLLKKIYVRKKTPFLKSAEKKKTNRINDPANQYAYNIKPEKTINHFLTTLLVLEKARFLQFYAMSNDFAAF